MPSYEDVLDTLNARNLEQMGRNNNTIIESNNKTENTRKRLSRKTTGIYKKDDGRIAADNATTQ